MSWGKNYDRRMELGSMVEFHLIGQHDQSSHSAARSGGRGASGSGGGFIKDIKNMPGSREIREIKKLSKNARKEPQKDVGDRDEAPANIKSVLKKNGLVRLNPLKASNVSDFSDNQLQTLEISLDANLRSAKGIKQFSKVNLNPVGYGVGRWREKRIPAQQKRVKDELISRGIEFSVSFDLESVVEFQTETKKEISLAEEIAEAKKILSETDPPKITSEQKAKGVQAFQDLIEDLEDEPEDPFTPEIISQLKDALKTLQGTEVEASSDHVELAPSPGLLE